MPNLAGQALPYIRGLGERMVGYGERAGMALGKYAATAMRNPYAVRTSLGAIGGGLIGGMYAGDRGTGFNMGGALAGAGIGAAGARYGGRFMREGMTSGVSLGSAGRRALGLGKSDFRMAASQGRAAASFIGNTMTRGLSRIQGLGR